MTHEKVLQFEEGFELEHDRKLWISIGRNRFDKKWHNRQMRWSSIVKKLQVPVITPESYAEFMKMTKADQDKTKDIGGFVGGALKTGRRGADTVTSRSMLCFDLDDAPIGFWDDFQLLAEYACAVYSTHKHRPDKPRLRLVIPLTRDVSPDEYEAAARMLATDIGMDYMDPTTFQPSRLMYWPSRSEDAEYVFDYLDLPMLDPDTVLSRYPDWHDASLWPMSEKETRSRKKLAERQQDPTTKKGIVGAFCRAYDVPAAIDAFLPDIYTPTDKSDRYTYAAGSTAAGLVLYSDGAFAYSNHGTDPAGGQLCNAFDLVRIHKFGGEDENVSGDTPTNKRPSFKAMMEFAAADPEVRKVLYAEQRQEAMDDFDDEAENVPDPGAWMQRLKLKNNNGTIDKSVINAKLIFKNDEQLQGISFNRLSNAIDINEDMPVPWKRSAGPWKDSDDAQLVTYVATNYAEFSRQTIMDQKVITAERHAYHPVKNYLEALPDWDGDERVDTLLIDYLGAEDNIFTREATARILLAAVRRIYEPGCKFDTMLVLSGPPSTGKSMLVARLGGRFFSDNLTFEDMKDKTAAEKLQGYWLLEIPEMKGMRKMDVESVKAFISRQEDIYRAAYGHNVERHRRQCVIFGTVNDLSGYLKDVTGNRRFWPIEVTGLGDRKPWDLTDEDRDQIWAEILFRYKTLGERDLLLSPEAQKIAEAKQLEALEADDREGSVQEYLDTRLPFNWRALDIDDRLEFLAGDMDLEGTEARTTVSNIEIWCECFKRPMNAITKRDSYDIAGILRRLGWVRAPNRRRIPIYGQVRYYTRTGKPV